MTQQSCSKVVSLHMENCTHSCPNRNVCYHVGKDIVNNGDVLPAGFRETFLDKGYTIHESICNSITDYHLSLLDFYLNYNVTLPYELCTNNVLKFERQVQISIYNIAQAKDPRINSHTKLFLIKDKSTYEQSFKMWNSAITKIHLVVDKNFITEDRLKDLVIKRMLATGNNVTIDSCIESFIINGKCPYDNGTYVDITYDGTVRACPFEKNGIKIPKSFNLDEVFTLCKTPSCKYKDFFSGVSNGSRNNSST